MAHMLKAAELEWDRIDLTELEAMKLDFRRKRKYLYSQVAALRPFYLVVPVRN